MAMVDAVSQLPTGRLMAQVGWLGPKVDSHLVQFCIHCVNRVNSRNYCKSWWQHHKPGLLLILHALQIYILKHCPGIIITCATALEAAIWSRTQQVHLTESLQIRIVPESELLGTDMVVWSSTSKLHAQDYFQSQQQLLLIRYCIYNGVIIAANFSSSGSSCLVPYSIWTVGNT